MVYANPGILLNSVEGNLMPKIDWLAKALQMDEDRVFDMVRRRGFLLLSGASRFAIGISRGKIPPGGISNPSVTDLTYGSRSHTNRTAPLVGRFFRWTRTGCPTWFAGGVFISFRNPPSVLRSKILRKKIPPNHTVASSGDFRHAKP